MLFLLFYIWILLLFLLCFLNNTRQYYIFGCHNNSLVRFSKYRVNIIVIQTVIKVYLSYWIILFNFLASFLFINLFKGMHYYNDWLVNIRFNTLDWFMVLVILLVSSCVIVNSIDYLTIMESYLFLVYISLFQFCMITFVLSNDLLIAFLFGHSYYSLSLILAGNLVFRF